MKNDINGNEVVQAILGNIHTSLKWLWQIIMALALVKGVEIYVSSLESKIINSHFDSFVIFWDINTLVFGSFIFIFLRFYFGDNRYLDLSYLETSYSRGLENELEKFSGFKRFSDILLLLTHGIFFYFMSRFINNLSNYLFFFNFLLIVNVIWLFIQVGYKTDYGKDLGKKDVLIGRMKTYKPIAIWIINNITTLFVMFLIFFSSSENKYLIGLAVCIINSIVDFIFTWKYYFPDLKPIYDNFNKENE
jgi:hypothetical protein